MALPFECPRTIVGNTLRNYPNWRILSLRTNIQPFDCARKRKYSIHLRVDNYDCKQVYSLLCIRYNTNVTRTQKVKKKVPNCSWILKLKQSCHLRVQSVCVTVVVG
ncbi:uncharacterized protein LOC142228137 isoform X2 [Haematobia irritans]|uniref:uncharacterized protein LOC142228137 isoform X2 n=1 Tax=Haematobia irritans TaxID=7368 RepID=UPI003F50133A